MAGAEVSRDARLAATFLINALNLPDDADTVGQELTLVDRDQVVTVFAAEFESSVGPAAFLLYVYRLAQLDDDGRSGQVRFAEDLETLETAARLDTPGPRAVGHAQDEREAVILATSPAVLRALRGEPGEAATPRPLPAPEEVTKIRGDQAFRLLRMLRSADRAADQWLNAIDAAGVTELTPEELELSLFLNDEQSIKRLLQALNRLLSSANAAAIGRSSRSARDR